MSIAWLVHLRHMPDGYTVCRCNQSIHHSSRHCSSYGMRGQDGCCRTCRSESLDPWEKKLSIRALWMLHSAASLIALRRVPFFFFLSCDAVFDALNCFTFPPVRWHTATGCQNLQCNCIEAMSRDFCGACKRKLAWLLCKSILTNLTGSNRADTSEVISSEN
jgi:hypothetical protein